MFVVKNKMKKSAKGEIGINLLTLDNMVRAQEKHRQDWPSKT
jgi:hypothetical protein